MLITKPSTRIYCQDELRIELNVEKLPIKVKPVSYGKFNKVKPGQTSFAIGHPEGLLWTFTSGMVSQVRPNYNWR